MLYKRIVRIFRYNKKIRVMSKPLDYIYSTEKLNLGSSTLAQKEKNDCVVKAIAAAAGVSYEISHAFAGEHLKREKREGRL